MHAFHQLPPELFYEIALHLPLTRNVLTFTLTNSRIREALSTPALFKARLTLQGWDISAWKDEDDAAQSPGDLERWMYIDYIYCRTMQLFDEAAANNSNRIFHYILDERWIADWLKKLSEVLPLFVTHHRGGNISRITDTKYRYLLYDFANIAVYLYTRIDAATGDMFIRPRLASSDYGWFERVCFSLMALLIQCDATTIVSIFTDINTELTPMPLESAMDPPISLLPDDPLTLENISECYSRAFLFQAVLCIMLHLDAEHLGTPELEPPTLPHFEPCTTPSYYSYFSNLKPFGLGIPTITTTVRTITPSALPPWASAFYMRPWPRDGLSSMSLTSLSTTDRAWAGYYTYSSMTRQDPPMYLELRTSPPPPDSDWGSSADSDPDCMSYFSGEGHDSIGPFTVSGRCDAHTGVVSAIKAYEDRQWEWEWHGVLTPFGMAGTWCCDSGWDNGWWWIWPREWSHTTTQYN